MNAAHAADLAFAASSSPGGGGSTAVATQLLFFAAIFAIFWFLLIRPQQKQKREREQMLAALKRGDRVVTSGGLHGTVTSNPPDVTTRSPRLRAASICSRSRFCFC